MNHQEELTEKLTPRKYLQGVVWLLNQEHVLFVYMEIKLLPIGGADFVLISTSVLRSCVQLNVDTDYGLN